MRIIHLALLTGYAHYSLAIRIIHLAHFSSGPGVPNWFDQRIDHFSDEPVTIDGEKKTTFKQRYYQDVTHFKGNGRGGYPIFFILGGDGDKQEQ